MKYFGNIIVSNYVFNGRDNQFSFYNFTQCLDFVWF